MKFLVGIDDTDSSRGGCTTYLAYRICTDLPDVRVIPYPRLVRLNPNIPFKTRGNAAICLQVETGDPAHAFESICHKVREHSDVGGGANTGVVFLRESTPELELLYHDALTGMVNPKRVRNLLSRMGAWTLELGNGMGIVGAAAAAAFDERTDHTYELVAYRRRESFGSRRELDPESVRRMDSETFPRTFNNYDYQKKKVLLAPHGPDPVFVGVRGESPGTVLEAFRTLEFNEPLQGHLIFVSNQHTDAHFRDEVEWKAYSSGWLRGSVLKVEVGPGGHCYLEIESSGEVRPAVAYEPTGDLRRIVRLLRKGDKIRAYGGVRRPSRLHQKILNIEKIEVEALSGASLLTPGTYVSSPRANRHLTKPLIRYSNECLQGYPPVDGWIGGPMPQRVLA